MPFEDVHLRKVIRFLALPRKQQISKLRADIREERSKNAGGGDFYSPFWADAKRHIRGDIGLRDSTESRIEANDRRRRLYPLLCEGFLNWWRNQTNRWGNQDFRLVDVGRRGSFDIDRLDTHIKAHNLLDFSVGTSQRVIYPYWFHEPPISDRYARMTLAGLQRAFPEDDPNIFKVLDIERGTVYSGNELHVTDGDYEAFVEEFSALLALRESLLE